MVSPGPLDPPRVSVDYIAARKLAAVVEAIATLHKAAQMIEMAAYELARNTSGIDVTHLMLLAAALDQKATRITASL